MSITRSTALTQKGRVVANTLFDKEDIQYRKTAVLKPGGKLKKVYANASTDDKFMHVVPGELLFSYNQRTTVGGVKKRKRLQDTELTVFSSLNGIVTKSNAEIEDLESNLIFAGFADTQVLYNSEGPVNVDGVTQLGGLRTTTNTGTSHIKQGDLVYWSLPTAREAHGRQKVVGAIRPLRKHTLFGEEEILKLLNSEKGDNLSLFIDNVEGKMAQSNGTLSKKEWAGIIAGISKYFFEPEYKKKKARIIGKALSSAKPGEEFDILIGGSYSI